jgi:hypothetical protein
LWLNENIFQASPSWLNREGLKDGLDFSMPLVPGKIDEKRWDYF